MNQSTCSIDGCEKPLYGRNWCTAHYTRNRRYGDPLKLSKRKGRTADQRFAEYAKPAPGGCTEWSGGKLSGGYGSFQVGGKSEPAHKWAWERAHGAVPPGRVVRHKCDNPPCVKLAHLELGTPAQNSGDMVERGRSLTGSTNPHARLTEEDVLLIREMCARSESRADIARSFGVSLATISHIAVRRSWKHV